MAKISDDLFFSHVQKWPNSLQILHRYKISDDLFKSSTTIFRISHTLFFSIFNFLRQYIRNLTHPDINFFTFLTLYPIVLIYFKTIYLLRANGGGLIPKTRLAYASDLLIIPTSA